MIGKIIKRKIIYIPLFIVILLIITKVITSINTYNKINVKKVYINNNVFISEVSDTDEKRSIGLSGRKYLRSDHGMLFIMPNSGLHQFWMKDMNFPLDFVWINKNKIVDLSENIPNPTIGSISIPIISSHYPSDKVLELNTGSIKLFNIKIGDSVKY